MKTVKFTAVATTAYGKRLDSPLPYGGEYEAYESFPEMRAANDLLKDDEQLRARNGRRKQQATTAAKILALEAIGVEKPTIKNSPQLRLREMCAILMAAGIEESEARTMASANLKTDWEDDDE